MKKRKRTQKKIYICYSICWDESDIECAYKTEAQAKAWKKRRHGFGSWTRDYKAVTLK